VSLTPRDQILTIFESILSANTKQNGSSSWIRALGGMFEGQNSCDTVPSRVFNKWTRHNSYFTDYSVYRCSVFRYCIKGQYHEIFDPRFFIKQSPRVLIHGLKPFRIWLRIRREYSNWFSRRKRSHMWNGSSPWIRALGGIVWWRNKKPGVENLMTLSL
jgi:hypothetical protein